MKIYKPMELSDLLYEIDMLVPSFRKAYLTLSTWKDGDYFLEICEESGGGIEQSQKDLFTNQPIAEVFASKSALRNQLSYLTNLRCFYSVNGEEILFFDINIWIGKFYFVYNPALQRGYIEELSIIKRFFSPVISPEWRDIDYYSHTVK